MNESLEPRRRVLPPQRHVTVDDAVMLWADVLSDRADLSVARRDASSALAEAGGAPEVVADVSLAMTELVVNALTHGEAAAVDISVGRDRNGEQFVLVVRHTDRERPEFPDPPTMAAPSDLGGRGRAIVAALAQQFETIHHGSSDVEHIARFSV